MSEYKSIISEEVRDGPLPNRRCTDVLCCLLFTVFLVAMFVVGVVGFANGEPELLIYPYDSDGHQCGRPNHPARDYKYIYYPGADPDSGLSNYTKYRICLKHCPDGEKDEEIEAYNNDDVKWSKNLSKFILYDDSKHEISAYKTVSLWKRFCLPDPDLDYFDKVLDHIYADGIEEWITDILRCWTAMIYMLGISVAVCIVYLFFLRYCVGVVVWTSIVLSLVLMGLFGYYIAKVADEKYGSEQKKKTHKALIIASYCVYGAIGLFIIIFHFLYRRIKLAIAVMKSGVIFLKDNPSIVFVPIVMFVLSCIFYIYWTLALIYIYSSGELKDSNSVVAHISWSDSTRHSLYFEIVGILWINAMKIALSQFIIACTVSIWYFTREKAGYRAILRSAYYSIRYHLGSLAFGSLLLSLVKLVKFILWYMKEKVYKQGFEGNKCLKIGCKCLECYVNCFERFIKFLDKNAYIQIALMGDNFCVAAKNAFFLILENAIRFAMLGAIGDIFKIIGKMFITAVSAYLGFLLITHFDPYQDEIESPIAPTCVFALIAYTVSGLFMSIHEMACDTIIQAFLIDERLHIDNAQFAPEPLKAFMKENKDKDHSSKCCGCL